MIDVSSIGEADLLPLLPPAPDRLLDDLPRSRCRQPSLWALTEREFSLCVREWSEPYADIQRRWPTLKAQGAVPAVRELAEVIAKRLTVRAPVVAPLIACMLLREIQQRAAQTSPEIQPRTAESPRAT